MPVDALDIQTSTQEGERIVQLTGEIDLTTVSSLIQALRKATESGNKVMVDMSGVSYLDSQGVRALRNAHQQAIVNGGALRLRGCHGVVDRVLRLVGLDRVIPIVGDECAAAS